MQKILIEHFAPVYLHIVPPDKDGDMQIIISAPRFKNLTIQQRITEIFTLLYFKCADILENRLIVIQAFSEQQMHNVLKDVFSER